MRRHALKTILGTLAALLSGGAFAKPKSRLVEKRSLEVAFEKSSFENWQALELMALAAASMGLLERQKKYDELLSKARGWEYLTKLKQ